MPDDRTTADWQPDLYLRFKKERTQPTIDLVTRIALAAPERVLDIGCGPGNSTAVLRRTWPDAELFGLDSSASMLARAKASDASVTWVHQDASQDMSFLGAFDLIFSNAALQWIPDMRNVLPRLFGMLRPGGLLAVQSPYMLEMPIHDQALRLTRQPEWKAHFPAPPEYPRHLPYTFYYDVLCALGGELTMWQTDYIHVMPGHEHVVGWYKGSGLRAFLDMLPTEALQEAFTAQYTKGIEQAYPKERDNKVLLPYRRVFFLLYNR